MPLEILALLVTVGIGGIVLLVHLTGGSRAARLEDDAAVIDAWRADWQGDRPIETLRNEAGTAAMVALPGGEAGLVWSFGADTVSRRLYPGAIRALEPGADSLTVRFAAFDCPAARIALDPLEQDLWYARLSPFVQQETTR